MRTTRYFVETRQRIDRRSIEDEWIERGIAAPERVMIQPDGRLRHRIRIPEAGDRVLRIVLLADGETVRNAFFDRRFES